jgi:hypothetical protein
MKNIVLYIFISLGLLLVCFQVSAQKQVIELLPTNHQIKHPEAITDTLCRKDTLAGKVPVIIHGHTPAGSIDSEEHRDRERIRTGWHINAFHLKRIPHRPLQLFFQITALK